MLTKYTFRFRLSLAAILAIALLSCLGFGGVAVAQNETAPAAPQPLAFAASQPPQAFENEAYSWSITATGGLPPYACSANGSLPPGLFLDATTCAVSGTPPKGVPSDTYTFGIKVTDSSDPAVSIEAPFTITVQYRSNISISSGLSSSQTNVYVDGQQVGKLSGGQKISRIFPSGTKHTISVDASSTATGESDARLSPVMKDIVVDGLSPDAYFDYSSEYEISVKSNQTGIPQLPGSGWFKDGDQLSSTAPAEIDPETGVQYRFDHWQLPTGEIYSNADLNWKVTKPGEVIAVYDTYYQLTVNSEHCEANGTGWYKVDSKAVWNIKCSDSIPAPGFWGYVGVELRPQQDTGTVLMDAPKDIEVIWKPDYSRIIIPVVTGLIAAIVISVFGVLHGRIKAAISGRR